jgi:hypothetical protein
MKPGHGSANGRGGGIHKPWDTGRGVPGPAVARRHRDPDTIRRRTHIEPRRFFCSRPAKRQDSGGLA